MPYIDDEISQHDGQPIELYRFVGPTVSYYYTSYYIDIIKDGNIYVAIPLKRAAIAAASADDPPSLDIEIPFNTQLIQDYAFALSPRSLELTIFRRHGESGGDVVYWEGTVASFKVEGRIATIRVPSTFAGKMSMSIPSFYFQTQCNHTLYDQFCQVNRAGFQVATTVTALGLTQVSFTVGSVGANPNDYFKAGEILRNSDGERRLILGQTGTSLSISYPFRQLLLGDSVTLFAGCDHVISTCRTKFNNVANFGGQPYIPIENPYERGLK